MVPGPRPVCISARTCFWRMPGCRCRLMDGLAPAVPQQVGVACPDGTRSSTLRRFRPYGESRTSTGLCYWVAFLQWRLSDCVQRRACPFGCPFPWRGYEPAFRPWRVPARHR